MNTVTRYLVRVKAVDMNPNRRPYRRTDNGDFLIPVAFNTNLTQLNKTTAARILHNGHGRRLAGIPPLEAVEATADGTPIPGAEIIEL